MAWPTQPAHRHRVLSGTGTVDSGDPSRLSPARANGMARACGDGIFQAGVGAGGVLLQKSCGGAWTSLNSWP